MHDYEITFILNPNLADDEATANTERISTLITNGGGEIVDVHPWGGKRRLAYPIEHHRDGLYFWFDLILAPEAVAGLERSIGVNENIVRHLVKLRDPRVIQQVRQREAEADAQAVAQAAARAAHEAEVAAAAQAAQAAQPAAPAESTAAEPPAGAPVEAQAEAATAGSAADEPAGEKGESEAVATGAEAEA